MRAAPTCGRKRAPREIPDVQFGTCATAPSENDIADKGKSPEAGRTGCPGIHLTSAATQLP